MSSQNPAEPSATANGAAPKAAADVFPDFAISLEEANRRIRMLQEYVREHMVEGEDFGVIPGGTKPTLFKPGAEKLNAIFGLAPMVEVTNRLEDWERGFVSYEVKVTLINKRNGQKEAEGVGACNSAEKRYRTQDAANIANTILKMGKKRALIDATITATRASGLFTQDLEDMDLAEMNRADGNAHSNGNGRPTANAQRSAPVSRNNAPPAHAPAPADRAASNRSELLTDAQHRAILAITNRLFGHVPTTEELARFTATPLEQLKKAEASDLIDQLRAKLAEQQAQANGHSH